MLPVHGRDFVSCLNDTLQPFKVKLLTPILLMSGRDAILNKTIKAHAILRDVP